MALFFFFNDTATTEIYTLSLHDALPISEVKPRHEERLQILLRLDLAAEVVVDVLDAAGHGLRLVQPVAAANRLRDLLPPVLARELEQPRAVELGGMRGLDRLTVALLPVADEVRVEHARPA